MWKLRDVRGDTQGLLLFSILLLALLRGGLYASFLPPWGLIDEEQHIHYIQHLAEQSAIPLVGQTYLSREIVNSLFETRRWEVFHWRAHDSRDPMTWGLEGHSYEGYQPPLFYILFVPLYVALPSDILVKVYGLRWAMVCLALLTVWMAYRLAAELFPLPRLLPYLLCLLLVMIPERTISVSRVNNDVLLEVVSTAFIWGCTRAMLKGLTVRQSQLLGLLFGLGVLTKTSAAVLFVLLPFVFWMNRHTANLRKCVLWTGGIAVVLIAPFVARNLWLYGDLTGFAAFRVIAGAAPRVLTGQSLAAATWDLFRHFWVVWWKGSVAAASPIVNGFMAVLAVLSIMSLVGLVRYLREQYARDPRETRIIIAYACAVGSCAAAILASYFSGSVPVIQGRFFLPAIVPAVILFCWGLWRYSFGKAALLTTIGALAIVDALALFANLLPYFYYWSAFVEDGVPKPYTPLDWQVAWNLFYLRLLSDKPAVLQPMLVWLLPLYLAGLAFVGGVLKKCNL